MGARTTLPFNLTDVSYDVVTCKIKLIQNNFISHVTKALNSRYGENNWS